MREIVAAVYHRVHNCLACLEKFKESHAYRASRLSLYSLEHDMIVAHNSTHLQCSKEALSRPNRLLN